RARADARSLVPEHDLLRALAVRPRAPARGEGPPLARRAPDRPPPGSGPRPRPAGEGRGQGPVRGWQRAALPGRAAALQTRRPGSRAQLPPPRTYNAAALRAVQAKRDRTRPRRV